tara:strand:+ start:14552 stop:14740 length:189 start_codon:yes stop_codon:yes gene_type:complete
MIGGYENIVPKYNQCLKKLAWVSGSVPETLPGNGNAYQNKGEEYVNCWFREKHEALAWLESA